VKNTYSCIYLGEKGLVEYEMRDSKDNITQNILIFDTEMVLEKITLGSHYNWYKNIHNVGLFNDIFTIDGSTKKSDEIAKKAELNWNKFLYENKVIKDIERKGVYEYHSRILFSKKIIVFFDNNDLHVITDTNAQYLSKKEVTIPINSPQYTHATLLHLVLNDIENDKIIPVANLVTEFNSNLILYFVEKQFNKTFNGKKSEPAKIANKVNKESIYKLLPEPIRNCTHSWVMGPEKSCSICGKVQSYPPPHGCQKCGILLCDECYDFASS
jgi:hypothetical protein